MVSVLTFTGTGDSCFECQESYGDACHDDGGAGLRRAMKVIAWDGQGLIVTGQYCHGPIKSWAIGLAPLGPSKPLPNWPLIWSMNDDGQSLRLEIHAPDDVSVSVIEPAAA